MERAKWPLTHVKSVTLLTLRTEAATGMAVPGTAGALPWHSAGALTVVRWSSAIDVRFGRTAGAPCQRGTDDQ